MLPIFIYSRARLFGAELKLGGRLCRRESAAIRRDFMLLIMGYLCNEFIFNELSDMVGYQKDDKSKLLTRSFPLKTHRTLEIIFVHL